MSQKNSELIKVFEKFPDQNPNPVLRFSKEGVLMYYNESSNIIWDNQCFINTNADGSSSESEVESESEDEIFIFMVQAMENDMVCKTNWF